MWHYGRGKVKNWKENTVQNTPVTPLYLMCLNPASADLYYNSYNELSAGHWGGVGHNELPSSDGTKHDRGWYQGKNGQGLKGSNRSICPITEFLRHKCLYLIIFEAWSFHTSSQGIWLLFLKTIQSNHIYWLMMKMYFIMRIFIQRKHFEHLYFHTI